MRKSLFWLVLMGAAGWLIWQWVRQRQAEMTDTIPQFAPPRRFGDDSDRTGAPATSWPAPADAETSERVAGAAEGAAAEPATPAAADTAERDEPAARFTAPPPAATTASANERATIADSLAGSVEEAQPIEAEVIGYCVRCKTKRPIHGAHEETTETGRRAARGTCPVCGANMFTFLKDDE